MAAVFKQFFKKIVSAQQLTKKSNLRFYVAYDVNSEMGEQIKDLNIDASEPGPNNLYKLFIFSDTIFEKYVSLLINFTQYFDKFYYLKIVLNCFFCLLQTLCFYLKLRKPNKLKHQVISDCNGHFLSKDII